MFTLKQDLGCPRRMTVYAIFDILDRLKSSYDQVMTGDIQAQVSVFGKECLCAFAVRRLDMVKMCRMLPCRSEDRHRAVIRRKTIRLS